MLVYRPSNFTEICVSLVDITSALCVRLYSLFIAGIKNAVLPSYLKQQHFAAVRSTGWKAK
jgi:hypothetical protein